MSDRNGVPGPLSLRSVWDRVRRGTIVDSLSWWMIILAAVGLFGMMALMGVYVVSRKFGMPIPGSFHASEQMMMIVFSFPLAAVALRKGHILFELIFKRFSLKTQTRLELVSTLVGMLLFGIIAWKAWEVGVGYSFAIGEYKAGVIDFPVWPFRIALAVGLSVFSLQLLVIASRVAAKLVKESKEPEPERRPEVEGFF